MDLYKWNNAKETKAIKSRIEAKKRTLKGITFTPKLSKGSKRIQKNLKRMDCDVVDRLYKSKKQLENGIYIKNKGKKKFRGGRHHKRFRTPINETKNGSVSSPRSTRCTSNRCSSIRSTKSTISTVVTERSIVVLNEDNQFEEINSYIKKQRKIKKKLEKRKNEAEQILREKEEYEVRSVSSSRVRKETSNLTPNVHNQQILCQQFSKIDSTFTKKKKNQDIKKGKVKYNDVKEKILEKKRKSQVFEKSFKSNILDEEDTQMPLKSKRKHKFKKNRKPRVTRNCKKENNNDHNLYKSQKKETDKSGKKKINFLMINGEKIFFDDNSVSKIVKRKDNWIKKSAERLAKSFKKELKNLR